MLIPSTGKLTVKFYMGNYVVIRDLTKPLGSVRSLRVCYSICSEVSMHWWLSMHLCSALDRIGMHLLFCRKEQVRLAKEGEYKNQLCE